MLLPVCILCGHALTPPLLDAPQSTTEASLFSGRVALVVVRRVLYYPQEPTDGLSSVKVLE